MKRVLVLGAGLCAGPLVATLSARDDLLVTVVDMDEERARARVHNRERATARCADMREVSTAGDLFDQADLCVSFLPDELQVDVAKLALAHKTHLVTPSGTSSEMQALDASVRRAGLTFLNEMGLDPGIDHMASMRIIHRVTKDGGRIRSFSSFCGGIPAPDACTNPWDYKFSWNPRKTVLMTRADAVFLEGGRRVFLPGTDLFSRHWIVQIPGFDELEAHFNSDSTGYVSAYGLDGVDDFYRATLRYPGWSFAMENLGRIGYLDLGVLTDPLPLTYSQLTRRLIGIEEKADLKQQLARLLRIDIHSGPIRRMEWLGLLSDDPIIWGQGAPTPLDALANIMLAKMPFAEGERDLCVMNNVVGVEYPDGKQERVSATLVAYGRPGGDSAMAFTVGLTAAIGALHILDGRVTDRGVILPMLPSIYGPVLHDLSKAGVELSETVEVL